MWSLPLVDLACKRRILTYYASVGVHIPPRHADIAIFERLLVYLPVGLILSHVAGWLIAVLLFAIIMLVCDPVELYLMRRGVFPWRFLKGVRSEVVIPSCLLGTYNAAGHFLLGVAFGAVL